MKIALIDAANLYYCCKKKYQSKVDYEKLITALGADRVKVYGTYLKKEAVPFIDMLHSLGAETKFLKTSVTRNLDVSTYLIVDMMKHQEDDVIICSTARSLKPVLDFLKTPIWGIGIPATWTKFPTTEIPKEYIL